MIFWPIFLAKKPALGRHFLSVGAATAPGKCAFWRVQVLRGHLIWGAKLPFSTISSGHYFEAPVDIDLSGVGGADDYAALLRRVHVIVDRNVRIDMIRQGATKLLPPLAAI